MVTRRSFMRQLGVAGAAGVYFGETLVAGTAQADVRVTPKLQVRAGVRWERTENALTEWDPRLRDEVESQPDSGTTLFARVPVATAKPE